MNHRTVLCLALAALTCTAIPAHAKARLGSDCDLGSRHSFRIDPARLVFIEAGSQREIVLLPGGDLQVDGRNLALDPADRARADALERGLRELVPEVKGVAIDAIGIAFEAVGHAASAFASSPAEARRSADRVARVAAELQHSIETKQSWDATTDAELERAVEQAVGSLVGEMVGNVTTMALKLAFSGDEAAIAELEARADAIEKTVEAAVEQRSAEIERRAAELCSRLDALDGVESAITARLPDGSPLDLVRPAR